MSKCKYCLEEIQEGALICKHCGKNQEISSDMQKHLTFLSVFYFAVGGIALFASIVVSTVLPSIGNFVPKNALPFDLFSFLGAGIGGMLLLTSIVKLLCGYGLLKRKSWGRIYALVLAVLGLIAFPFGTLIGIYAIWVLAKTETAELFVN